MSVLRGLERCYLRLPSVGSNTASIAKASLKVKTSRERSVKVMWVCMCLRCCLHHNVHECTTVPCFFSTGVMTISLHVRSRERRLRKVTAILPHKNRRSRVVS